MGFETFVNAFVWVGYFIFELCPYGIWNFLICFRVIFLGVSFELCPYGIWNMTETKKEVFTFSFELCPYGIWNVM